MFTYLKHEDDLIPSATLSADTEDAAYPVTNLQVEPVSKTYRTTDINSQKVLMNFAAAVDANAIALVNHNLTATATITIKAGSSPDPDGSSFTASFSPVRRTTWAAFGGTESWRYWSITIDDVNNTEGFLEVGLLMLGVVIELSRDFDWGYVKRRQALNQMSASEYGVVTVGAALFQRTEFSASWKTTSTAERTEMDDFLIGLNKEQGGFLFIPDPDELEAFYGRLISDYELNRTSPEIAVFTGLGFLEDSPGVTVTVV